MSIKKPSGKGGHHLRVFWPSNASHYTGRDPGSATHLTQNWGPPVRGIAKPSKVSFQSGGNTYKLKTMKKF